MRNFQQKRGLGNILRSRPVLVILGILVLVSLWGMVDFVDKMETTRDNRKKAENRIAELEKEKKKLSYDIAKLKTESGIEENIRLKFGLAKEGEKVIVVLEDQNSLEIEEETRRGGFFSFIKNLFR